MLSYTDLYKFNTNFLKRNKDFNPGIKILKIIENNETGAYLTIGEINKTLVLSFRGTEISFKDIFSDSLFFKSTIPYISDSKIKVHTGFLCQYMSIRKDIFKFIKNKVLIENVIIVGHSLGGALASLCILDLFNNFKDFMFKGIVFGSPKVGNKFFLREFKKNINDFINIQNVNDLIVKLPPNFLGFKHIGNLIKIDKPEFPYISIKKHLNYDEYL